jgi:hypothetical protein
MLASTIFNQAVLQSLPRVVDGDSTMQNIISDWEENVIDLDGAGGSWRFSNSMQEW